MMCLPKLKNIFKPKKTRTVVFGGINYSDNYVEGEMSESENISTRRYPYLATRYKRTLYETYEGLNEGIYDFYFHNSDTIKVMGEYRLYYNAQQISGGVSPGMKQWAVVGNKLVIWPDMKMLDLQTKKLSSLGATANLTFDPSTPEYLYNAEDAADLTELFKAGDTVNVYYSSATLNADGMARITKVETHKIYADNLSEIIQQSTLVAVGTTIDGISVSRRVPCANVLGSAYICESGNRLWICYSGLDVTKNEWVSSIAASALGDPTNFETFEGVSTDSYQVAVASDGSFTGCASYGDSVVFFKENVIHKVLGDFPSEYALYSFSSPGVKAGCYRSIVNVNEKLFYLAADNGVYVYTGSVPTCVSDKLGFEPKMMDSYSGAAGTDGHKYYISVSETGLSNKHLYVLDTDTGVWIREDNTGCAAFGRKGGKLYMLTDNISGGKMYLVNSGEDDEEISWSAVFKPMYETIEGRKTHSKLIIRAEVPRGAYIEISVKNDGGLWKKVGTIIGGMTRGASSWALPLARCDKFEVKLEGIGASSVLSMMREYTVGSDR